MAATQASAGPSRAASPPPDHPNGEPVLVSAEMHDVKLLYTMLRGINISPRASVQLSRSGMVVAVEEARSLLATAYIFAEVFDKYSFDDTPALTQQSQHSDAGVAARPDRVVFEVPLGMFVDCLNVFGTATAKESEKKPIRWRRLGEDAQQQQQQEGAGARPLQMAGTRGDSRMTGVRMVYADPGHPLEFVIFDPDSSAIATVGLTTFDCDPMVEMPFDSDSTILKIILKSSWLRDALAELDACDRLTIIGNPPPAPGRVQRGTKPRLRLRGVGTFGSTEMDYPSDREVLETCECDEPVSITYTYKLVAKALRALQNSTKTSLRIDAAGLLSLQFLMPPPKNRASDAVDAFVEFRIMPLEEPEA